jgi:hypothetical protein
VYRHVQTSIKDTNLEYAHHEPLHLACWHAAICSVPIASPSFWRSLAVPALVLPTSSSTQALCNATLYASCLSSERPPPHRQASPISWRVSPRSSPRRRLLLPPAIHLVSAVASACICSAAILNNTLGSPDTLLSAVYLTIRPGW